MTVIELKKLLDKYPDNMEVKLYEIQELRGGEIFDFEPLTMAIKEIDEKGNEFLTFCSGW